MSRSRKRPCRWNRRAEGRRPTTEGSARYRRRWPAIVSLVAGAVLVGACGTPGAEGDGSGEAGGSATNDGPLDGVHGMAPAAVRGLPSVITLTPVQGAGGSGASAATEPAAAAPSGAAPPVAEEGRVDQFGLMFSPTRLIVRAGSTVRFTNSESALTHNVHVRSVDGDTTVFNGDATTGETIRLVLPDQGAYDVLCDMHPGMSALVFATTAPYAVFAANDGAFVIPAVPPGSYTVGLWTADGGLRDVRTVMVGEAATEVRLPETG